MVAAVGTVRVVRAVPVAPMVMKTRMATEARLRRGPHPHPAGCQGQQRKACRCPYRQTRRR